MQEQNGPRRDLGARPVSPLEKLEPALAPARPKVQKKKKRKKRGRTSQVMSLMNGVLTALLLVLIALGTAQFWLSHKITSPGPLVEDKRVTIARGKSEHQIANILEKQGVISSRYLFLANQFQHRLWAYVLGHKPMSLKAGDYLFNASSSVEAVAAIVRKGKSEPLFVVIPEGLTSYQIVRRLRANKNLIGEIAEVPPEGFLMPATYDIRRNEDRARVLKRMAQGQRDFLRAAWDNRQPGLPYKDVSEALILASIIEKEMGPRDEPTRIAGVFVNRLRRGMRLQSDPTILYGKFGPSVAWGSTIYRSDIRKKTTHNTYQIDGLPPTPICNPGRAAIEAALNPATTKDLYFVADGKGGHIFSATLAEHNAAVKKWRQIEKKFREARKAKAEAEKRAAKLQPPAVILSNSQRIHSSASIVSSTVHSSAPDGTPLPQRRPALR